MQIHPIIQASRLILKKTEEDRDGFVLADELDCVDLRVTRKNLDRGLAIMNLIFGEAEERGYKVSLIRRRGVHTQLQKNGIALLVALKEQSTRVPHVPTAKEQEEIRKWPAWNSVPRYDFPSNGKLIFEIHGDLPYERRGIRTKWVENNKQNLEQMVPEIFEGLEKAIVWLKAYQTERAEKLKQLDDEQRKREDWHLRRQEEKRQFDQLAAMAAVWDRNRQIREFLDAVEGDFQNRGVSPNDDVTAWLRWARRKILQDDPIRANFHGNPTSG